MTCAHRLKMRALLWLTLCEVSLDSFECVLEGFCLLAVPIDRDS